MRNFIKNVILIVFIVLSIVTVIKPKDERNIEADGINIKVKEINAEEKKVMSVNKSFSLSKYYVPKNLIEPDIIYLDSVKGEEKLLEKDAATAVEKLFYQAKMENINLCATSGYRSYDLQKKIYIKSKDLMGQLANNMNQIVFKLNKSIEEERRAEQTKNDLITNVSHDLRTPLTSIIGYLGLIDDDK